MQGRWFRSCAHWGAFDVAVETGRAVAVRAFARDPAPSPLLASVIPNLYARSRIAAPMVRAGWLRHRRGDGRRGADGYVEVRWDDALKLVGEALARTRAEHGNRAIFGGSYGWSSAGRVGHARTLLHRFLNGTGGFVDQRENYSWAAGEVILRRIVGGIEAVAGPVTDWRTIVAETRFLLLLGGAAPKNGRVTSGGAGEHNYAAQWRAARAAGTRMVVVSPDRDDAPAELGAEYLPIRPNTDLALMLGIAHSLITNDRHDKVFLEHHAVGADDFIAYLRGAPDGTPKDADWAAAITGVPAERIRRLADELAGTRSLISATWSLQRAERGEYVYWGVIALAALVGQIGLPGGGFAFGYGSINGMGGARPPGLKGAAMATGDNPVGLAIPVARVADLLEGGKTLDYDGTRIALPDIHLVYWAGGNPFHHHQDVNRLLAAWQRPDCVIVQDSWWSATARHADIVLPATTTLERTDVSSAPRDRFLFPMRQAVAPVGLARNDYDIFRELSAAFGVEPRFSEGRDMAGWARHLYETARAGMARSGVALPDYDAFVAQGHAEIPPSARPFVLFEDFRRDPRAHPLATPSGRIEIASAAIAGFGRADCPGLPEWRAPREWLGGEAAQRHPLHLLSVQPPARLHGQLDDGPPSLAAKVAGREPIRINPADARRRGIRAGDVVRVFNDRGAFLAGAVLTDALLPGVASIATGARYCPVEPGRPGTLDAHGNPNLVAHDRGTSAIAQGPAPQSTLVEIERWTGDAPPVERGAPVPATDDAKAADRVTAPP
jgi:biotin/methionine sulfoxide reductase